MVVLNICLNPNILRIVYYGKLLFKVICFAVPILLIVKLTIILYKNMTTNFDDKKDIVKEVKNKLILAFLIFMVFPVVNAIFSIKAIANKSFLDCWNNATTMQEIDGYDKTVYLEANQSETGIGSNMLVCYSKTGCYLELPEAKRNGYSFLGWSTSKECNNYVKNNYYSTTKDVYLYPCFKQNETTNSSTNSGGNTNQESITTKSNYTIFVGDSRTKGMCDYLKSEMSSEESCVAEIGKSLSWFKSTAILKVDSIINSHSDKTYNIVIDLGVNGLTSSGGKNYADTYNELKQGKWSKHNIIVTSVTPTSNSYKQNFNEIIKSFNNNLKSNLNSNIYYCDIFPSVLNVIQNSKNIEPDGLHYTKSGSREVYKLKKNCFQ